MWHYSLCMINSLICVIIIHNNWVEWIFLFTDEDTETPEDTMTFPRYTHTPQACSSVLNAGAAHCPALPGLSSRSGRHARAAPSGLREEALWSILFIPEHISICIFHSQLSLYVFLLLPLYKMSFAQRLRHLGEWPDILSEEGTLERMAVVLQEDDL